MPIGNASVKRQRRVTSSRHDVARGRVREPVGKTISRGRVGCVNVRVNRDGHVVDCSTEHDNASRREEGHRNRTHQDSSSRYDWRSERLLYRGAHIMIEELLRAKQRTNILETSGSL